MRTFIKDPAPDSDSAEHWMHRCLAAELECKDLQAEVNRLQTLVESLCGRVAVQSELLPRSVEA